MNLIRHCDHERSEVGSNPPLYPMNYGLLTSFRHGELTEAGDAGGSGQELRALAQHTNSQTTDKYVKTNQTQILNLAKKRIAHRNPFIICRKSK